MERGTILAFLIAICVTLSFARSIENEDDDLTWDEFADMLTEMPENEKYEFVREHVLRGYELSQQDLNSEDQTPDLKLSLAVFNVVKEECADIEKERNNLKHKDKICFPHPIGCISSSEPGVRPT